MFGEEAYADDPAECPACGHGETVVEVYDHVRNTNDPAHNELEAELPDNYDWC